MGSSVNNNTVAGWNISTLQTNNAYTILDNGLFVCEDKAVEASKFVYLLSYDEALQFRKDDVWHTWTDFQIFTYWAFQLFRPFPSAVSDSIVQAFGAQHTIYETSHVFFMTYHGLPQMDFLPWTPLSNPYSVITS